MDIDGVLSSRSQPILTIGAARDAFLPPADSGGLASPGQAPPSSGRASSGAPASSSTAGRQQLSGQLIGSGFRQPVAGSTVVRRQHAGGTSKSLGPSCGASRHPNLYVGPSHALPTKFHSAGVRHVHPARTPPSVAAASPGATASAALSASSVVTASAVRATSAFGVPSHDISARTTKTALACWTRGRMGQDTSWAAGRACRSHSHAPTRADARGTPFMDRPRAAQHFRREPRPLMFA
jgi:hypothetical protein